MTSPYYIAGTTHVTEVDPKDLRIIVVDKASKDIRAQNLVNGGYFWHYANGVTFPLGILVNEGRIISNRQPHNKPAGTFIVYKDGSVAVKELLTILNESNVWFAVSGCSIYPTINMKSGGFTGVFADIGMERNRPIIGYNPEKKKVLIAVRSNSNIGRAYSTAKNLGCSCAITLDAGSSTNFRVSGVNIFRTSRRLHHIITW